MSRKRFQEFDSSEGGGDSLPSESAPGAPFAAEIAPEASPLPSDVFINPDNGKLYRKVHEVHNGGWIDKCVLIG